MLPAAKADEALDLLRHKTGQIDLVLTDVVLPGLGGPELVHAARKLDPRLRVLFMSAFPREDLVARGRIEPGALVLEKPFASGEVCAKVGAALAQADAAP